MAIGTLDQLLAAFKPLEMVYKARSASYEASGVLTSLWYEPGIPGPASAPSPGLGGASLTAPVDGQIPVPASESGKDCYLGGFHWGVSNAGGGSGLLLADRLWHNSGITVTTTTAQTVTSTAWPARDADGATSGRGVMVGLEVSSATGNASLVTACTFSYTNSAGTSGRTGSISSINATAAAGSFFPFILQAGDKGVQSIQSVTLGTSLVSGAVHLVAYRPITYSSSLMSSQPIGDALSLGLPCLWDDPVPFLIHMPLSTTANQIYAGVTWAQG